MVIQTKLYGSPELWLAAPLGDSQEGILLASPGAAAFAGLCLGCTLLWTGGCLTGLQKPSQHLSGRSKRPPLQELVVPFLRALPYSELLLIQKKSHSNQVLW